VAGARGLHGMVCKLAHPGRTTKRHALNDVLQRCLVAAGNYKPVSPCTRLTVNVLTVLRDGRVMTLSSSYFICRENNVKKQYWTLKLRRDSRQHEISSFIRQLNRAFC